MSVYGSTGWLSLLLGRFNKHLTDGDHATECLTIRRTVRPVSRWRVSSAAATAAISARCFFTKRSASSARGRPSAISSRTKQSVMVSWSPRRPSGSGDPTRRSAAPPPYAETMWRWSQDCSNAQGCCACRYRGWHLPIGHMAVGVVFRLNTDGFNAETEHDSEHGVASFVIRGLTRLCPALSAASRPRGSTHHAPSSRLPPNGLGAAALDAAITR